MDVNKKTFVALAEVRRFIAGQSAVVRAEYACLVQELEKRGFLVMPQAEKVEPGLFAIRIRKGGNVRVFYIYDTGSIIYGIHAYEKKSQAIPHHELARARAIAKAISK